MKVTWDGDWDLFDVELPLTLSSKAFSNLRELRRAVDEDYYMHQWLSAQRP